MRFEIILQENKRKRNKAKMWMRKITDKECCIYEARKTIAKPNTIVAQLIQCYKQRHTSAIEILRKEQQ